MQGDFDRVVAVQAADGVPLEGLEVETARVHVAQAAECRGVEV